MLPDMVTADPDHNTHFENTIEVKLSQKQGYDIWYKIDDGDAIKYNGSITLNKTAYIYPYARATIEGDNYDSAEGYFWYYKCAADEILENEICVIGEIDGKTITGYFPLGTHTWTMYTASYSYREPPDDPYGNLICIYCSLQGQITVTLNDDKVSVEIGPTQVVSGTCGNVTLTPTYVSFHNDSATAAIRFTVSGGGYCYLLGPDQCDYVFGGIGFEEYENCIYE